MTDVKNNTSDFEKYLKNAKKIVEEALDFSLGPENPETLRESTKPSIGIFINSSEFFNQIFDMPEFSEPKTMADELPNLIFSKLFFDLRDVP